MSIRKTKTGCIVSGVLNEAMYDAVSQSADKSKCKIIKFVGDQITIEGDDLLFRRAINDYYS